MYVYDGYARTSRSPPLRWLQHGILNILNLHWVLLPSTVWSHSLSAHLGIGGAHSLARSLWASWSFSRRTFRIPTFCTEFRAIAGGALWNLCLKGVGYSQKVSRLAGGINVDTSRQMWNIGFWSDIYCMRFCARLILLRTRVEILLMIICFI